MRLAKKISEKLYSARNVRFVWDVPSKCGVHHKNTFGNVRFVSIFKLKMSVGSVILTVLKVNKGY